MAHQINRNFSFYNRILRSNPDKVTNISSNQIESSSVTAESIASRINTIHHTAFDALPYIQDYHAFRAILAKLSIKLPKQIALNETDIKNTANSFTEEELVKDIKTLQYLIKQINPSINANRELINVIKNIISLLNAFININTNTNLEIVANQLEMELRSHQSYRSNSLYNKLINYINPSQCKIGAKFISVAIAAISIIIITTAIVATIGGAGIVIGLAGLLLLIYCIAKQYGQDVIGKNDIEFELEKYQEELEAKTWEYATDVLNYAITIEDEELQNALYAIVYQAIDGTSILPDKAPTPLIYIFEYNLKNSKYFSETDLSIIFNKCFMVLDSQSTNLEYKIELINTMTRYNLKAIENGRGTTRYDNILQIFNSKISQSKNENEYL